MFSLCSFMSSFSATSQSIHPCSLSCQRGTIRYVPCPELVGLNAIANLSAVMSTQEKKSSWPPDALIQREGEQQQQS